MAIDRSLTSHLRTLKRTDAFKHTDPFGQERKARGSYHNYVSLLKLYDQQTYVEVLYQISPHMYVESSWTPGAID